MYYYQCVYCTELVSRSVFFNLFSEAEPFSTILIAHGTHVFFGGTPEAWRVDIWGQGREQVSSWGQLGGLQGAL